MLVEALVNDEVIQPFAFDRPENLEDHTTNCGANNYYYNNSTIHFVV
jgi:hypothetical protein